MKRRHIPVLLVLALATSCGPKLKTHDVADETTEAQIDLVAEAAVRKIRDREARLMRVAHDLRRAGVDLCGDDVGPYLGVAVWKLHANYRMEMTDAAARLWGLTDRLTVVYVEPGSPADRGGVKVGDIVLRANGRRAAKDVDLFHVIRDAEGSVALEVERQGEELVLDLPEERVCDQEVFLHLSNLLTTEGTRHNHAWVTVGFVRFAETDDELALVVGHALGHRILRANSYTDREDEVAAERLGLQLARRAGYDISGAEAFWQSVALEHPFVFDGNLERWRGLRPHGRYPERILAIREELAAD